MKIGILGGTFDPPHEGHLKLAHSALETLGLDEVLWIPNFETTAKRNIVSSSKDRMEMVRLLIENEPKMCVSDIEIVAEETNYTVDTLWELHQIYSAQFWLIVGSDTAPRIKTWKQPERLLQLCRIAVGIRVPHTTQSHVMAQLQEEVINRLDWLTLPPTTISSTQIREMTPTEMEINKLIPLPVKQYIKEKKLYQ